MSASTTASPYKPSPLGIGTPRSSPFRRPLPNPDSPVSVSSPLRNSTSATPTNPSKLSFELSASSTSASTPTTPSRAPPRPATVEEGDDQDDDDAPTPTSTSSSMFIAPQVAPPTSSTMFIAPQVAPPVASPRDSWSPRGRVSAAAEVFSNASSSSPPAVPRHAVAVPSGGGAAAAPSSFKSGGGGVLHSNALAKLQPTQMRMLRDSFEVLDRDGDGVVNRDDVADMFVQLGLPVNPSSLAHFFPPGSPPTATLAAYLNGLASALSALSPGPELLSAFSAFDDDDSGQADLAELRDALLHTTPEPGERALSAAEIDRVLEGFSGRRAFTRSAMGMGGKRGDVFRYQEFVGSVMGSGENAGRE